MVADPTWHGPDFAVIGAAKAGTTALWSWLGQHPEIFLPEVKEPGFFAFAGQSALPGKGPYDPDYVARIATDWKTYRGLYAMAAGRITGDVSPVYAAVPGALAQLAACRPDARIIMLLRDPARRAFSQYLHHRRDGLEPCPTFEAALDAEAQRIAEGWNWAYAYAGNGHYLPQVRRLLRLFPREQVLFLDHAALVATPEPCWKAVCAHLGIAPVPMPENRLVNATRTLTSLPARQTLERRLQHPGPAQRVLKHLLPRPVRRILRRLITGPPLPVPVLTTATRDRLRRDYARDWPALQALTGIDLAR